MTKITKAVIAAAGWSTRFLPAVKAYAKHLVPILDKPQIQYLVEECVAVGIDQICIVHRDDDTTLKNHFSLDPELESYLEKTGKTDRLDSLRDIWRQVNRFEFITQPKDLPYGNGTPILAAQKFIGNDPFVYMYGDDLTFEQNSGDYLKHMIDVFGRYDASAVAATQTVSRQDIVKGGSVKYTSNSDIPNRMDYAIEKPKVEEAPSLNLIVSPFVLAPRIIYTLKNTTTARGELWLTDALNNLAKDDHIVIAEPIVKAKWLTTGDPMALLKANLFYGLQDPKYSQQIRDLIASLDL